MERSFSLLFDETSCVGVAQIIAGQYPEYSLSEIMDNPVAGKQSRTAAPNGGADSLT